MPTPAFQRAQHVLCCRGAWFGGAQIVQPIIERTQSLAWLSEQALTAAAEVVKATLVDVVTTRVKQGALKARLLV